MDGQSDRSPAPPAGKDGACMQTPADAGARTGGTRRSGACRGTRYSVPAGAYRLPDRAGRAP